MTTTRSASSRCRRPRTPTSRSKASAASSCRSSAPASSTRSSAGESSSPTSRASARRSRRSRRVQADLAYPAVVVCPASLKLNWLREIETWLPGRKAIALSGRTAQDLEGADLVVLNYEIAAAHLEALGEIAPRALILDESHYVKNPLAVAHQGRPRAGREPGPGRAPPRAHRDAGRQPPRRAGAAAPGARPPRRVRDDVELPPRLRVAGLPAKAPLAPSELVLSAAPKGRRPDAAARQAPRRRAGARPRTPPSTSAQSATSSAGSPSRWTWAARAASRTTRGPRR